MFSSRIEGNPTPNRLARALEHVRAGSREPIDLTESNPTRAGIEYPADLLAPLAHARGLRYVPAPFGTPAARQAVARDYERRGLSVPAHRIVLTASTSEAYALIFKVLCDPGDEVLVPRPSYPLFEFLTRLDGVVAKPYDLDYQGAWTIDMSSVEHGWSDRTRALLIVSPNNPTGSFVSRAELERLGAFVAARDAAIVADEVFADYELVEGAASAAGRILTGSRSLAFSLSGLSKSAGMPQVKLGWMAACGPDRLVSDALARLEIACDSYLSVSTPVQEAAAELMREGAAVRRQIQARIIGNYTSLMTMAARASSCDVLAAQGGWYAVLHVPSLSSEEELVVDLVEREGVLVHPGYFFDFPRESYLIVSLLTPAGAFREGVSRILARFGDAS
jgi:aspartate/methionine/tyrosine aminotransferase